VDPPPEPLPDQVFSGAAWELTVPHGWKSLDVSQAENPQVDAVFVNAEKLNLIVVMSEDFTGTMDEYVLSAIRGLKDSGGTFNSATQVELNGLKFILLESEKNNTTIWVWVTVHNECGFTLSCGGPSVENLHKDICTIVASSFKLRPPVLGSVLRPPVAVEANK
jgi:hypothetical protein